MFSFVLLNEIIVLHFNIIYEQQEIALPSRVCPLKKL